MPDAIDSILFSDSEKWRQDYWCKPVSFNELVTSKEHLNLDPLSEKQYEAIYALIGTDPLKVFSMDRVKRSGVYLLGKGSGKDYMSSITQCYIFYLLLCLKDPHSYLNFPFEEAITLA